MSKTSGYIALVHKGNGTSYGVSFPDVPGCISAGDTFEEAIDNASQALAGHLAPMETDGDAIPKVRNLEELRADAEFIEASGDAVVVFVTPRPERPQSVVTVPAASGFLLKLFDSCTRTWLQKCSIVALPVLRPTAGKSADQLQRNRDIFVVVMLGGSVAAFAGCYFVDPKATSPGLHLLATLALYRALDVLIMLLRTGVFLSFRGDTQIDAQPRWRIQRTLLGVLTNYFELVLWYSVIYLQIALGAPCEFDNGITNITSAFQLSYSTITTIGYGKIYPYAPLSNAIAFAEAMTGIIFVTLVVGVMLALLSRDEKSELNRPAASVEQPQYWLPIVGFLVSTGLLFLLLGIVSCT